MASRSEIEETSARLFGDLAPEPPPASLEIDAALQGDEALEMVQDALASGRPYAVAFVDVRVPPGWDGIETVRRIWQVDPRILVVICTAYSDHPWEEIAARLNRPGQFLILKKPFDNMEIRQLACSLTEKWDQTRLARLNLKELNRIAEARTQEIRESEARISAVMDAAADAIIITDERGEIQTFNRAADTMFGYRAGDGCNRDVSMLMPESDRTGYARSFREFFDVEDPEMAAVRCEIVGLRKNGATFPGDLTLSQTTIDRERLFVAMIRDATERNRHEWDLEA